MLTSFGSGEIWKGSNQEITVALVPHCYKIEGEITDVVLNFYTTAGGTSIEFSGDTVTVSGINATVVFQPIQLDVLDDGLIRYNVAFNEGGEPKVFGLETRYILKTPNDYEPIDYVTHDDVEEVVEEVVDEKMGDYYTSGQTDEKIAEAVSGITVSGVTRQELDDAIAAETARTENTYIKEHQSLDDYYTKEQTDSAITAAIEAQSGTTSAQTQEMITEAMAAETARTEQAYLKQGTLADYYTSAQTDTAIQNAISGIDLSDYYTSAQTDSKISEAIATESARTEQTYLKPSSLNDYYTSAQTNSAIAEAVSGISGGLAVYDYDVISGDSTARTELINLVSGGTQTAVVVREGIMYYYRGYDEDKYIFVDYKNLTLDENAGNCRWGAYRSVKVDSNGAEFGGYGQDLGTGIQAWMYTTSEYQKHFVEKNGFLFASENTYDIIPGSTPVIGETYTTIYFTITGMLWWSDFLTVSVNGSEHDIAWWGGKAWIVDGNVYDENHTTEAGMTVDFSHIDNDGHGYIGISAAAMTVTDIPNEGEGGGTSVSVPILATTNLQMYRNGEWNSISAIPNLVYSGASHGILASAVSTVKAGLYNGAYAGTDTFYILVGDLSQEVQSILYESVSGVSETVTLKAADYTAVIVKTISSGVYSLTITENPSVDLSDYWTSAQTQSAITSALTDYYTSGQTNTAITNAVNGKVSSSTITQIWSGSQQAYDAMTGHSANILYIINS